MGLLCWTEIRMQYTDSQPVDDSVINIMMGFGTSYTGFDEADLSRPHVSAAFKTTPDERGDGIEIVETLGGFGKKRRLAVEHRETSVGGRAHAVRAARFGRLRFKTTVSVFHLMADFEPHVFMIDILTKWRNL